MIWELISYFVKLNILIWSFKSFQICDVLYYWNFFQASFFVFSEMHVDFFEIHIKANEIMCLVVCMRLSLCP